MINNQECIFTFSSTHAAISAEECLANRQFPVRVMAKPDSIGAGCGLCLRLDVNKKEEAFNLLLQNDVPIEHIFLATRTNQTTEYLLWSD